MQKLTVRILLILLTAGACTTALVAPASAATTVLDPGPGTDYLGVWCGGQQINEIATGFDAAANPVTLVKVATTCHGSGRGSPNQYYLACWTVTFARDGGILSKEWLATNHWSQGNPAVPCPVSADPAGVYTYTDGAEHFPATLSTTSIGASSTVYRAVLETTCAPIDFSTTVPGTISAPGAEACYSWSGAAGDGIRVSVVETSGTLAAAQDVYRPDGTALCSTTSGVVDCALDAAGLQTIVVRDSAGTETGTYDLTLTCLTPSCGAVTPAHLTIGMTADLTSGRWLRTLTYTITVQNDGGAPVADVAVRDSLPQGLFVRSLSTTQGNCTYTWRDASCAVGAVPPAGSVTVTLTAVTLLSSGQVTNVACLDTSDCATTITSLP